VLRALGPGTILSESSLPVRVGSENSESDIDTAVRSSLGGNAVAKDWRRKK